MTEAQIIYDFGSEIARLRAELAQRTAELERLEAHNLEMRGEGVDLEVENNRLHAELAHVWQQRDQYLEALQQVRRRTHEIQEAADKRYSLLVKELRDWEWWKEILGRVDQLIAEPGIACHSAVTRTVVGHLLAELQQARGVVLAARETHDWSSIIHRTLNPSCLLCRALDATPAVVEQQERL